MQLCAASVWAMCRRCAGLMTLHDKAAQFVSIDEAGELCLPAMTKGRHCWQCRPGGGKCEGGGQAVSASPCHSGGVLLAGRGLLAGRARKKSTLRASTAMRSLSTSTM